MRHGHSSPFVLALDDAAAVLDTVGGKGASLARLARANLPVPAGFHVTTAAYRRFIAAHGLQGPLLATVSAVTPDEPATLDAASQQISRLFAAHPMPEEIAIAIRRAYATLGGSDLAVAVRSSATAEDLPELSFAGQQETYLNVHGDARVLEAVKRCWASLWTARAIDYRARHGIAHDEVSLAVVVQRMVDAEAAGILFTAHPLTGARDQLVINAAWGLGEAIVGGQVTPDTIVVEKASGKIIEQQIREKTVMTVRTTEGTHEEPVPADRRTLPVLDAAQVKQLIHVGLRIERLYDRPMDIEWARSHHHLFIMQARPITALHGHNPTAGEWNDSLFGDYLWSNGNLGEAIPDVMTPCTWSLVQIFMADAMASISVAPYYGYGNIGGRFYMNLSISAALTAAFGFTSTDFRVLIEDVFGRLPEGLEIPLVPLARWHVLRRLLPVAAGVVRRVRRNRRRLPAFLAAAPARCEALHARIQAAGAAELVELWQTALAPFFHEANRMLEAAAKQEGSAFVTIRHRLRALVGEADANALLTGLHGDTAELASLGPLLGLTQLARGEIDRATFARRYGHRSPHEFEVSLPRPAEDPAWIDQQLAGLRATPVEVAALLARQREAQAAAWERFVARSPRRAAAMRRHMARMANVLRHREAARSEVIRVFGVLRAFVLRAGELTGQGDGLFFLSIDEVLDVLTGDNTSLDSIAARRAAHARYTALPPYPALIRGHFDPFRWAADPRRRSDIYDATHVHAPTANGGAITGFPGAAGVVEGRARVLRTAEEGEQLRPGDILVTSVTNVGWTPLFPRAAAIVTDIGAPLSHAAIVARELGIPAVVGCGDATLRLRTGDRVRVDGGRGTVEVLPPA